jgi:hypothetical protein
MPRTGVLRVTLVLLALGSIASWGSPRPSDPEPPPVTATYVAGNGRFAVTIVPKPLEIGPEGLQLPAPSRPAPGGRASAFFYTLGRHGRPALVRRFDLVDEVVPTNALVSEDGRFLVTFDSWNRADGKDAVVIYRTDGSLVRSLSLEDILSGSDIEALVRWAEGGRPRWREGQLIDESETLLVLRINRCGGGVCLDEPPQVALHLADGTPLRPARDLLAREVPRALLGPGEAPDGRDRPFHPEDPRCPDEATFESAPSVPFERLQAAVELTPPAYTIVAAKARVSGAVVLELFVANGAVACVRTIKDLPIGVGRAARETALAWRFPPLPSGEAFRTVVKVQFDFHVVRPEQLSESPFHPPERAFRPSKI